MDNTQTLSAHTCTCNGVQELLKINAHWSHCYNVLLKKYRGLEDVEKKYHNLKRQLKETKEMLRSFEEAACIFSMADFELLKNELISYKNMVDRETLEREKLTQHNQNLENQLKSLSKEVEIFASENKTLKKDMELLHNERNNLIDQVKTWFDSLKGYPASNICDKTKTAVESFFQDTQGEDIVKTEKNCQLVESLLLKSEKCVL